jgi:predicted enzyme related to lactoylglutathione lyase
MDYWMLEIGIEEEQGINGAIQKREKPNKCDDAITTFVCWIIVPSLDKYSTKILRNGGKIETPKMEVPWVGRTARFKDTEGNIFGIIEMNQTAK